MNTVSQIQSAISSKKPISFRYSYSHPDTNRIAEPMSLANGSLVARENGNVKRFNIDGINLISTSSTPSVKTTIQQMINANATMVFTYSSSQPEKVRYASPIEIKGDLVIAVEADTGKYKRFKLEGINFINENREVKEEGEIVENEETSIQEMIVQAITSLEYREGCSRPAIRKYIIDNFNISSYTLDRKLNIALKRGIDSNLLIQNGQHFKVNKAEKKKVKLEDSSTTGIFIPSTQTPEQRIQNLVQKHIDYKEPMTFKYLFSKPDLVRTFYPESIKNYIVTGKENGKYHERFMYKSFSLTGIMNVSCIVQEVDPSEAPTVPCSPSGVDEPTLPEVKVNDFIFQKVEEEANMDIYDDYGMLKLTRRDAFVNHPKNYKGLIGRRIRIELPYDITEDVYVFNVVDEIAYVEFPNGEQVRLDMNETPYKVLPRSKEYMHFKQLENKTISFVHTRLNIPVKITISEIEEMYVEDTVVVRGIVNGKEVVILSDEIENFKIEV
jgi:hypothetical protein